MNYGRSNEQLRGAAVESEAFPKSVLLPPGLTLAQALG